jgi:putative holliday junction resolvase
MRSSRIMARDVHHCAAKQGGCLARVDRATTARRILAIDYGRRRLGLALSDELGMTARPFATILRVNRQSDLRRIRQICRDHSIARIIVGHPLHMSGAVGEMAAEAARFAARLNKATGIETELVDERLTSWQAGQTGAARRGNRRAIDDLAAAVLLREYLERTSSDADSSKTEND